MNFLQTLQSGHILLADGATGTVLQSMGLPIGEPPERWTLENPDAVRELARLYADAGCDLVYTNTFGANRIRLQKYGLHGELFELNRRAVQLAREGVGAVSPSPFVIGSIGPTGELLEPLGGLAPDAACAAFTQQATALVEAGVDGLVCESFTDLQEALLCLKAARAASKVPVLASMSFEESGRTMMGVAPADAIVRLSDAGAAVVGANCSVGPEVVERVVREMKAARPEARLLAKPNAGLPRLVGGKAVYSVDPQTMATFALNMKQLGIAIVGGCCGTTPSHIRAMAKVLRGG